MKSNLSRVWIPSLSCQPTTLVKIEGFLDDPENELSIKRKSVVSSGPMGGLPFFNSAPGSGREDKIKAQPPRPPKSNQLQLLHNSKVEVPLSVEYEDDEKPSE